MSGPGIQLPPDDPRIKILNIIRPPAFFLLCAGSLSILFNVLQVVLFVFKIPSPFAPPEAAQAGGVFELSWFFVLQVTAAILCGSLAVWAALSAMQLKGYGLATVGAITALFPSLPACFISVPVAVWMLFTLRREGVREAFRN
ncbi:hypothetical protein [Pyxidicoccus sp. MSG2]|uniref:hypothetical protein n=1 Tax=Pyxidicoccus sp. MSG2 TaxID=2996790 RepID=UPI00226F96AC|nr:hypothetical protein [Pyxidicoccus sp. MSG2]MCY1014783.1 hypothetical protein [Pyxidicoccus sp. MSG2]